MNRPQDLLNAVGPAADMLAGIGWIVLITFAIAAVITGGILIGAAVRRRGTLAEHAPPDVGGGQGWILIGGVAIPGAVLATMFVITLQQMSAFPLHETEGREHPIDIRVVGRQWWFEAIYEPPEPSQRFRVPTEIHIPVGRPVTLALETRDVIHSFWVPKLHGKVDLIPGRVNYIQIQADVPGVYRGECAEFCGMQHAHMILLVVAEPTEKFDAWRAQQIRPAAAPTSELRRQGERVFLNSACVLCHDVRGTRAFGLAGPDLTHVGSRRSIAALTIPNTPRSLFDWITNPQRIKPGARMPGFASLPASQRHALVAYLEGLR